METSSDKVPGRDAGSMRVAAEIWGAKILIVCVATIGAIAGAVTGKVMERKYEATTLVAPVEDDASSGPLGALASRYGGLASLAGISLGAKGSKKEEALAILQSELLTERYIKDNDLLPVLYAKDWDNVNHQWKISNPKSMPTLWKANRLFKTIRTVTEDKRTGLVVVSIKWKDPVVAAKWANDFVRITNDYLRDKAIREAERNIAYLNEQASKTSVLEAQKAIYSLLEQELNKEMLARGHEEYALSVLDPAIPPERPSPPGATLLGIAGLFVGGFLAIMWVFWRRMLRET